MNRWYYLKKAYALFPGGLRPVSAPFLQPYYRRLAAARGPARLALDVVMAGLFRLWTPWRARGVARVNGLDRAWVRRAERIAADRFVDPNDVAMFRMQAPADADRFLRRFEYAALSKRINPLAWRRDCALADKAAFAERLAALDLPTPPVLARVRDGRVVAAAPPSGPDLLVKPTRGIGGKGVFTLELADWSQGAAALDRLLRAHPDLRHGDWLVQPRLRVHPDLAAIALQALPTARLTTMRDEAGGLEIVTAVLRFPGSTEAVVDNLAAGGLSAAIALDTGELGPACYGRRALDVAVHPVTQATIEGRRVPDWPQACALALRAHAEAFPDYTMVGWDVGFAEAGPVLIEGNGKPGLFAGQRVMRLGAAETRLGPLIAHHLARAPLS